VRRKDFRILHSETSATSHILGISAWAFELSLRKPGTDFRWPARLEFTGRKQRKSRRPPIRSPVLMSLT